MKILETVAGMRDWCQEAGPETKAVVGLTTPPPGAGGRGPASLGLVPTMGYLHAGHLALVRAARRQCRRVIVSIFVNPTQFDRADDLAAYPRDLARDRALLEREACDALFLPTPEILYPPGFDTWVEPGALAAGQEGEHRPGHFRGVATVVLKLLNIVQPTHAFFGRKDAQQLAIIRALVRDFDLPLRVEAVATVREPEGLALSSRNARLVGDERTAACVLYRALQAARAAFCAGERQAAGLLFAARRLLDDEPLARTEYLSLADPDTLRELEIVETRALLSLAVWIGSTRLIDNLILSASDPAREDGA